MTELKKYLIVYSVGEANEFVDLGYKLHTFHPDAKKQCWIMSLSSEKAYDNITELKDVHPDEVTRYLDKGWIIADSWSKFIRMVKKA